MRRLLLAWRYAVRSLRRGGQRTVMATLCIAVGVMAVVALRLAGEMVGATITSDVRDANGGDLSVQSTAVPLAASQLAVFDQLQSRGLISAYEAIGVETGTVRHGQSRIIRLGLLVLDHPNRHPLTGTADFASPSGGTFASTLNGSGVVLTRFVAEQINAAVGTSVHVSLIGGAAVDVPVTGILEDRLTVTGPTTGYVNAGTFARLSTRPEHYGIVNALTPNASTAAVASEIRSALPTANVQTVQDALDRNVQASTEISQFLQIVSLLALLIGGFGIVNTLQVMLSRRRLEIAVLKTVGFRRLDLALLFGLEAAVLGLAGGVIGVGLGTGLSLVVKTLLERVLLIHIVFSVPPLTLLAGLAVGVFTSLIFGVLPIVRASGVRPLAVIRDLPEGSTAQSRLLSLGLHLIVIALFTALAGLLLGDGRLAAALVIGTVVALSVLTLVFLGLVVLIGRLPVPARPTVGHLSLVTAAVVVAAVVAVLLPAVGVALLAVALGGYLVLLLPRRPRSVLMLALRSLSRGRLRTAGTAVALFVGVFAIGTIVVIGADLSAKIGESLAGISDYSVFAVAQSKDAAALRAASGALPGVTGRRVTEDVAVTPVAVNGTEITEFMRTRGVKTTRIGSLNGVEGYDLGAGAVPDAAATRGRGLRGSDAGGAAVMVRQDLAQPPWSLHSGDRITVRNSSSGRSATLMIAGFYTPVRGSGTGLRLSIVLQPILADRGVVEELGASDVQTVVSMSIDPHQRLEDLRRLENQLPDVTVFDIGDLSALVQQLLGNIVDLLVALASLALFAGVVIIANTVALVMLERRREIGILKATGHTSGSVLAQVVLENAIVGGIAGIAGMTGVSIAAALLGRLVLNTDLAVPLPLSLGVIASVIALAALVAAVVARRPSRTRPLEVLRYE